MKKGVIIYLDNGHGDETPGKASPWVLNGKSPELYFRECEWNRSIVRLIANELQSRGYDCRVLVPEHCDISLSVRVARVNKTCELVGSNRVVLVSVHSDASGNGSEWMKARGWSCFTTPGQTQSDKLAECLYGKAELYFSGMKIRKDMSDGDRDFEANLYILKHTKCAAVLTENFFYDNVDDCRYLLSGDGIAAIVDVHVDAIEEYIAKYM